MSLAAVPVAFYAPMKPPDHPTPSGDRRVARLLMNALERAGYVPTLVSRLRSREPEGDPAAQARLLAEAEAEVERVLPSLRASRPAFWFTYHCYWKAPDLLGPRLARACGVPYVVAEGTRAPRRLAGPWARFARAAEDALDAADAVFWFTERDLPALEAARPPRQRLVRLHPFLDLDETPSPPVRVGEPSGPLRLLAVGMMRPPDKTASYRALAAALALAAPLDWRLTIVGDGPAEPEVRAAFARWPDRVAFAGRLGPSRLAAAYGEAEIYVWPGVNEGFGMAYLEAQAAGLPVIAEDRPGLRDVLAPGSRRPPPGDPQAFADALRDAAADRAALTTAGAAARAHVVARHGLDAAARVLADALRAPS